MPLMKNLFLLVCLLGSFSSFASLSIISDLDDTIKITEAGGNPTDMIGDNLYTGMAEYFKGAKDYSNALYILSASPSFMGNIIKKTLLKRGVNYHSLILRNDLLEDKFSYKLKKIIEILSSTPDDFILIGDDLGKDPEVYAEIKKLYPRRILKIYIHSVNGRFIARSAVPYWTSLDLTLREHLAGRMSSGWVEKTIDTLFAEKKLSHVFPKKAQCPMAPNVYNWQLRTTFQQEALILTERFVDFCLQRQSDNILP